MPEKIETNGFSQFAGKSILITGGLGFIGSNLAMTMVELGTRVTLLDNMLPGSGYNVANVEPIKDKVNIVTGDVREYSVVENAVRDADYVFHLAAQVDRMSAIEDPRKSDAINSGGTLNLLEACRKLGNDVRFIYAGSRAQVGEPSYLPVDGSHPDYPLDAYGASKLAGEKYCLAYHRSYGMKTSSLRLSNVYGPRGQLNNQHYGVVNLFIGYVLRGRTIPVYGKGKQTRDYIYVDDVVQAFLKSALADKTVGKCLMVGSGVETVFLDMAKLIVKVAGGKYTHVPFPESLAPVDIHRFRAGIEETSEIMNWDPQTSLEAGVRKTLDFYRINIRNYI